MKDYRLHQQPPKSPPPLALSERIRRYLEVCPPAISGQNGHTQTFKVALALVRGFNLNQKQALEFLRDYNAAKCEPAWSERELKHKLKDADRDTGRNTKKPRGYLL